MTCDPSREPAGRDPAGAPGASAVARCEGCAEPLQVLAGRCASCGERLERAAPPSLGFDRSSLLIATISAVATALALVGALWSRGS